MTGTMRRTPPLVRSVGVLLASTLVLAGCSGGDGDPSEEDPVAGSSSGPAEVESSAAADEGAEDTFADVSEPATERVAVPQVEGIEEIRFWEGSTLSDGPTQAQAALDTPDGQLVVSVSSRDGLLAMPTAEEAARRWARTNSFMDGDGTVVGPVVVDGVEVQRVTGRNGFAEVECFVHAVPDADVNVFFLFVLPDDMPAAEREERIGQVMATVELA